LRPSITIVIASDYIMYHQSCWVDSYKLKPIFGRTSLPVLKW